MPRRTGRALLIGWLIALGPQLLAETTQTPQDEARDDMGEMQLVFLGQADAAPQGIDRAAVAREQGAALERLIEAGTLAAAGEVREGGDLVAILVLKSAVAREAEDLAASLPAVRAGLLKPDRLTWFAARNRLTAAHRPLAPRPYVFGLLRRGPTWSPEDTPERQRIQEAHLANIRKLAETRALVLAGPFVDGGDRRGVFVFKVDSLDEARRLAATRRHRRPAADRALLLARPRGDAALEALNARAAQAPLTAGSDNLRRGRSG